MRELIQDVEDFCLIVQVNIVIIETTGSASITLTEDDMFGE
ncbi:MAG: hypothetical protein CM15mV87_370 [Caudoviricetes sp.]|nr:MAG: hypothetical protein CM15mV87_370 [Caudoviricetes sp.]